MKKLVFAIFLTVCIMAVSAQNLIDIYKKGTVRLVPDAEYIQGYNWDKVFETFDDTLVHKTRSLIESLKILPDGSAVVNHSKKNYYSKFSPNGKFEKEFGITNSNGERFKKTKHIAGIINNNTFFTELDNMGNMICFDFNGDYIKSLKLNYMVKQMIPLPNNKIAVVGWVMWSKKFRDFVAIVDYETNDQEIIWEHFTDRPEPVGEHKLFNYFYFFKEGGGFAFSTMPFSMKVGLSSPPKIAYVDNKLVIAHPATGEILVYDLEGNLKSKDRMEWANNYISVEEQKEIQKKAIEKYKSMKTWLWGSKRSPEESKLAQETIIKEMEADLDRISEPIPLPYFSTMIKDSDGNILFFEFPEEENANKFNVWIYENDGSFVCQSSFVCDEYNLEINPSKMVFHNGYIYGLQLLKKSDAIPLRLVRFKLTSN
jgi:hypothetical protein